MSASRIERLMELFEQALAVPPDERPAFVDRVGQDDHELRRELLSLLVADESAEEYFDRLAESVVTPAYEAMAGGPLRSQVQEALEGSYRLLDDLGGGMSRVFLAEDVRLDRKVVIKVLPPGTTAGTHAGHFRGEIHLAAQLQHPHIVPLLTSDSVQGIVYYTMPYVAGETLRTRIERTGPLPIREAAGIWRDVLEALSHAHASGVIHRDIKPANILLGAHHALVSDFGIASAIEAAGASAAEQDSERGVTVGTPAYMAPEQLQGGRSPDARVDIYAAGLVMYEMLSGRLPFRGDSIRDVMLARLTSDPAPLARDNCPPELCAVVMACLGRWPESRPGSADDVLAALDVALDRPRITVQGSARRRWSFVAATVALTSVAAFGAARLLDGSPREPGAVEPRRTTTNLEAYEWYRRGRDPTLVRGQRGTAQAMEYMERAIAADSSFAGAWAGLANILLLMAGGEAGDELALRARADSAALRAIALDDSLPDAHAALGWTRVAARDWPTARRELERAISLDPRAHRAYEGLARYHLFTGTPAQQLAAAERGVEVDPLSHFAVRELALALVMNDRCDEVLELLLPLKRLTPPAGVAGVIRGQCFGAQGKWKEAIEEFQWSMATSARTSLAFLGHALARAGERDSARAILDDLLTRRRYSHGAFGIAGVYLGLGDMDQALRWIEKAVSEGTIRPYLMGPMFDELRRDPRFARVRQLLGL